jgi:hypothetical protein
MSSCVGHIDCGSCIVHCKWQYVANVNQLLYRERQMGARTAAVEPKGDRRQQ